MLSWTALLPLLLTLPCLAESGATLLTSISGRCSRLVLAGEELSCDALLTIEDEGTGRTTLTVKTERGPLAVSGNAPLSRPAERRDVKVNSVQPAGVTATDASGVCEIVGSRDGRFHAVTCDIASSLGRLSMHFVGDGKQLSSGRLPAQ